MPSRLLDSAALDRLVRPVCQDAGLELVEAKHQVERGGAVLRVLIERPAAETLSPGIGGVSMEDCVRVSRALSAKLDEDDKAVAGSYRLEVSSPGVERPLVRPSDFDKFRGREAKLQMRAPIHGARKFQGVLAGARGDDVRLVIEGGEELTLPFAEITKANLVFRFGEK